MPTPWQPFNRVPNADTIAAALKDIPPHWSLTPLQEKSARRVAWQTEAFIPHVTIADLILNGEEAISKRTGKPYKRYWSGFGVRLGEASSGLLAIDVDGASAQPILEAISGGSIPDTVSWSSGKPGRYQLLFQIPESHRPSLREFTRSVVTEWNGLATAKDEDGKPIELLEFRYNRSQSALPPSLHPSTSSYYWLNSPVNTEVAVAPDWLCNLLVELAERDRRVTEAKQRVRAERERLIKDATKKRQALGIVGSIDLIDCFTQSVSRLSPEEIFNWSGHNFKYRGREWFGRCPQHQSQSGESFTVSPDSLDWHCFGCNVGGGVGEYRHFVNGGKGTPRRRDFFEITKELAAQAGIELPKLHSKDAPTQSDKKESKSLQTAEATEQKGSDPEPQWKVKARAAWRKNRQFFADTKESSKWCDFARPGANTIAFFKAGLGRGKTTRLRAWVREWKQTEDVSFLCLGYRNTLLLQLCGDKKGLGFHHLHEHSGMAMKSAPSEGIALCVDSLWRFSPEDFDDKIIILDEVKSVVKHLLHSSTVKSRDKIISLFAEAIRRARQVICLDGLMADWVVDYLHSLAPEKQIIRAENTYLGEKPRVNFLLGTVGTDDKVKVNDRSPWLKYLLEESPMPAVCSDSQVMIEALDGLLSAKGLKVLRVDSKTVTEQYVKDFLLNCDEYIEQHRPDVLLYTPSAESGVDVSIPNHFTHHFAFFFGVLDIDGILQMIGRIRDNIVKFVWCKNFVADDEKQHSGSPFTDQIAKSINEILIGDIATSADGDNWLDTVGNHLKAVIANSIDQNFRTSCIVKSTQNYEKSNLRECLREVLIESGYKVVNCTLESYEDAGKKTKEATEAVKRQNCADIFRAQKVAPELVDELKFDASWEERCKVIQAKLREKLPGIEDSLVWTEDFIYLTRYGDRNFINNLENYWLFTHPDVAKRQSQDNLHWMARRLHTFIGNVKSRWARIHALLQMNFERFLDPEKEWSNESPELIALVELGKKYSNALGKHPGKATPIQFFGNLLGLFGLKLKSRKDGDGKRWYRLNEEVLSDPTRQQVLACIETKLTQPKEEIDWESAINEAHGIKTENQPQTQTEQDLECTAPSPNFLYTNQLEGAVNNFNLESHDVEQILEGVSEVLGDVVVPVEELVEAFEFCQTPADFAAVIEWYSDEVVEDAIALAPDQPMRLKLTQWYQQLQVERSEDEPSVTGQQVAKWDEEAQPSTFNLQPSTAPEPQPEPIRVGQRVWAWIAAFNRWGQGIVSDILEGVSWDVRLEGECLDTLKIFSKTWIEPLGMSG